MSKSSLQDQLLKMGLTDKKKAKQAEKHVKKQKKVQRKTGAEDETKLRAEQARKEKADRDRELNLQKKAEEEKKAIYSRWVTLRYEHGIDYSLVWKVVLAAFLVVAVLSYWAKKLARINHRLNREMKQRKRIERQLRQEKQKIEQLAITDPLTGLFNRRHYDKVLPDEINRMHRNREWLSFVMLDIDCFKQYNEYKNLVV